MPGLALPREWLSSLGEIARFCGRVMGLVYSGRVFTFFGEALRQAGILITGSAIVIWGTVFILGLQCGLEGSYFTQAQGAPAYAGVFAAWCDLREVIPYASGYMLAANVGTGIVAEIGAMRISDEIDALEVMGVNPMIFLCATRLLAAWITLPFLYLFGVGIGYVASWLVVVNQIGSVSSGGYFLIFWEFQNPPDLIFSLVKGMVMATAIVAVGCYYGYTASGGPVGVGRATAKSMVLTIVLVHIVGMLGTLAFWGANPRAPIVDRLAIALLLVLLAAGSVALWIAVPLGCLRLAWRLAGTSAEAYLLGLVLTVAGMITFGALLVWINRLCLRVGGVIARYQAEEARYGPGTAQRFLRGPL